MFGIFKKSWPIISIFFTLLILASLFSLPSVTRYVSLTVMTLGLAAVVTFTVRRHVQAHRQGRITRPAMQRNLLVDLTGLLLTMAAVICVAGLAGTSAGQATAQAWGVNAGIVSGLLVGIAAGLLVSLFVRWGWGKLAKWGFRQAQPDRSAA